MRHYELSSSVWESIYSSEIDFQKSEIYRENTNTQFFFECWKKVKKQSKSRQHGTFSHFQFWIVHFIIPPSFHFAIFRISTSKISPSQNDITFLTFWVKSKLPTLLWRNNRIFLKCSISVFWKRENVHSFAQSAEMILHILKISRSGFGDPPINNV